jgi:glycosyl-4,4'-diaponeurosporenoate acyltransferase
MIFHLSGPWAIVINIGVWLAIHLGVGMSAPRLRPNSFNPQSWLYRQRIWERGGRTYRSALKVKKWKRLLPDGVGVFKGGERRSSILRETYPGDMSG